MNGASASASRKSAPQPDSRLTELNVFEATDIARGPLATVKVPLRLKPAYHGSWAESARVKPAGLKGKE